ncbi:MAG: hydantoinase/oxoprolinase family protein [Acidobacteriota bacterium]
MGIRIGIDSGGTFTDVMAVGEDGQIHSVKVPSTPKNPALGFEDGLLKALSLLDVSPSQLDFILHGTTVAINAILERRFPEVALITTQGFRHILEIARQTVPGERGSIYHWVKPPRVVPLERVFEIAERVSASGEIIVPLDPEEVRKLARNLKEDGVKAVAVSLINSYANTEHEEQIRRILLEEHPSCFLATSSETLCEFREYERTLTTCMNAVLMPLISSYLEALDNRIQELEGQSPLFVMKSSGGVVTADRAAAQPLSTALSGPAAAVLGMAWLGQNSGFKNIISFDMGGTSTDVALIESGRLPISPEAQLDIYTVRAPTVDVISIGSGGGSIAGIGAGDRVTVGPRSAGASPGPACYGTGGKEPTVTDANLVLGRIPAYLVGGEVVLDPEVAAATVTEFGKNLGLSLVEAAEGILEIAAFNMSDAVRQVSVRRGRDPRDFALFALGGAGPLHACRLAQILEIPTVVVPPNPGLGCALGLLVADVKDDFLITAIHREDQFDFSRINSQFATLESRATASLEQQKIPPHQRQLLKEADLRYKGMASELTVSVPDGEMGPTEAEEMLGRFHRAHQDNYGYSYEGQQKVEIVNLRVAAVGHLPHLEPHPIDEGDTDVASAITSSRRVYFEKVRDFVECPIYDREKLRSGHRLIGPAIIEQYDTNTVIYPEQDLEVDALGNLVITIHRD